MQFRSPGPSSGGSIYSYTGGHSTSARRKSVDSRGRSHTSRVTEKSDGRVITVKRYDNGEDVVTVRDRNGNTETLRRTGWGSMSEWSQTDSNGRKRDYSLSGRHNHYDGAKYHIGAMIDRFG